MENNFDKELQEAFTFYRNKAITYFKDFREFSEERKQEIIPQIFGYFGFDLTNNILGQRLNIECDNKELDLLSIELIKEYYENDISVEDMVVMFRKWLVEKDLVLFVDVMKNIKFDDVLKKHFPTPYKSDFFNSWSEIHSIVEEIYTPSYQQDDIDINDVIKEKRFEFESIFDNMHDSDEECYLTVAKLDNTVICTIYKSGDRSDVVIRWMSRELAVITKNYLDRFLSKEDNWLEQMDIMDEDQTFFDLAVNDYLNFHEINGELFYTMDSPRWGSVGTEFHLGTFIKDKDGKLVPCKFKNFVGKVDNYSRDSTCIVESYWKQIKMSAKDIYFQITKDIPLIEKVAHKPLMERVAQDLGMKYTDLREK